MISQQHASLTAAIAGNLLALVPKGQMDMVAAEFRTIFASPDPDARAATLESIRD